jgi:T5SS/PEP-CTERM-associated repeat protein
LVTGSGSVWSNVNELIVGDYGASNSMTIATGGIAYNGHGYIGKNAAATSNSVMVTGTGATWLNRGNLYVGYAGGSAQLNIGPGGSVLASNLYVGLSSSSAGNQINITGGSLYVTNAAHNAVLDVRCGLVTLNGGLLQVDILVIANACGQFNHIAGTLITSNILLDPNLDGDGDGLPNTWEQTHGLDPLSNVGSNGANGDPDGDGRSNLQEFLTGTDPTNSASAFRITTVSRESNNIRVTWMTGIGKTNALQVSTGGISGSYSTNYANLFVVTNAVSTITNALDIGGATNVPPRFYRVRLVP